MSEPIERRKPGRPRGTETKTSVSAWIPAREHDRIIRLAHQRDQSVSETVGQLLRQRLMEKIS